MGPVGNPEPQVVSASQQSASNGNSLPFTGYLAIPVLLGGVALAGTGLVLRKKSKDA